MKGSAAQNFSKQCLKAVAERFKFTWKIDNSLEKGTIILRVHPSDLEVVSHAVEEFKRVLEKVDDKTLNAAMEEVAALEKVRQLALEVKEITTNNLNIVHKLTRDD